MNLFKAIKNPKPYILVGSKRLKNIFRKYFYKGNKVYCEICNWRGKRFFDDKCPNCNSLPRTRLVPFSLKHFDLVGTNPRILHIAPNKNEYNYIRKNVTQLPYYDRLNIRPVAHINIVQDLTNTNLEKSIYDLVIAWHVLEHIPEDLKAISEVYRLLKPKGKFLVSVPIYPDGNLHTYEDSNIPYNDFKKIHGHFDHCRSCGLDYYKRFETIGFKTDDLFVNTIDLNDLKKYGLSPNHLVWCFTK